ncbi:unnamed protein product [Rhizophagus irregularis]|nr:unnamed protein product [Rhizophagus irregularis]
MLKQQRRKFQQQDKQQQQILENLLQQYVAIGSMTLTNIPMVFTLPSREFGAFTWTYPFSSCNFLKLHHIFVE